MLAVIIEEISGIPYQKYVEQNVFSPCGMIDSGFFTMNELPERTANGYVKTESGWRTNIYNLPIVGAGDGGAFVTVEDMKKFWISLFSYKIKGLSTLRKWPPYVVVLCLAFYIYFLAYLFSM